MPIIHLLILAVVQAATEFLPVSSSGHLIAIDRLTEIESSLALDVMLHFGTLIALVLYYRQKLLQIARDLIRKRHSRLFINIMLSSIPAVLAGLLFEEAISGEVRAIGVVIFMLAAVGLVMVLENKLLPAKPRRKIDSLRATHSLGIGVFQSLALIPGTSRSGATIIGGRLFGLSNSDAADYAFLIGIPVIFGAGVRVLLEAETRHSIAAMPLDTFIGVAIAAMAGYLAISVLLKVLKASGLKWFGVYRLALAALLLLLVI